MLKSTLFICTIFLLVACSDDEECPQYPANYSNTFDISDFDGIAVYSYDGVQLEELVEDPNTFRQLVIPGDNVEDLFMSQQLIQKFTITGPNSIDVNVSLGDLDTTFSAMYQLQETPNFYTIFTETNPDFIIGGVEFAEDCSFVDVCQWVIISYDEMDLNSARFTRLDGCFRLSKDRFENTFTEFLDPQRDAQRKIVLVRYSQLFMLEE